MDSVSRYDSVKLSSCSRFLSAASMLAVSTTSKLHNTMRRLLGLVHLHDRDGNVVQRIAWCWNVENQGGGTGVLGQVPAAPA